MNKKRKKKENNYTRELQYNNCLINIMAQGYELVNAYIV